MDELDRYTGLPDTTDDERDRDEQMLAYIENRELPDHVPWTVADQHAANRAMERVAAIEARAADYDDQAALYSRAAHNLRRGVEFLKDRLGDWAVELRHANPKAPATVATAHGAIETRRVNSTITFTDEAELLDWCKAHLPDIVNTETREWVTKTDVKAHTRIVNLITGWHLTDTESGVTTFEPLDEGEWLELTVERVETRTEAAGAGFVVKPEIQLHVVDERGFLVPGVDVVPGYISPTVKARLL